MQQALTIARQLGDPNGESLALSNMGGVYSAQGRYPEALAVYEQALAIRREIGDRAGIGTTLDAMGSVYEAQGRDEEALAAYQQALDMLEEVRAAAGSERGRAGFIAQYVSTYDAVIALLHRQGQDEAAFFTSERGRARAFLDALATGQVQLGDSLAAGLLAQEQTAYARLQDLLEHLVKARAQNPPDPAWINDLEAQLAEAEKAYAAIQADIEAQGGQLADLVPSRGNQNILDVAKTQGWLDPQTTLLAYYALETKTLAFLLRADSFQVVELDVSREDLAKRVNFFRKLLELKQTAATQQTARELYQVLLAPLADFLVTPRLIIVPHGPLHYLPFAALFEAETGQYLVERHELVTLPSASTLPFIQENVEEQEDEISSASQPSSAPALIIGNPANIDFDTATRLGIERGSLGSLPSAEREAETIAALYGVEPLLEQAATEGTVRRQAVEANIIHLAAHGYYNPATPLSSLIALTPDESHDGWLTVEEVYGLDLRRTDLVVLSACQTHMGELSAGDDVVGLTRAFIFAGTPTVIASLWNVDDTATSFLMERFYSHLQAGVGKAEALRQAQLETMIEYPDPYYWAAFVLSGDGGDEQARGEEIEAQASEGGVAAQSERAEEQRSRGAGKRIVWWMGVGLIVMVIIVVAGGIWSWRRLHRPPETHE